MRFSKSLLAVLLAFAASNAQAAVKDHKVKYRQAIREDGRLFHETKRQFHSFRVEIVNDTEGVKYENFRNGLPFVNAVKGERYSVRLYNPLPVRVAVNLTVDGLNSITGQPSGISDGQKWMIEAYSSITIPGWQINGAETRRFFFTEKPKSYAKWRGDVTGKDLSANCGVIGAAYFWNQKELDQYYENNPIVRYTQKPVPYTGHDNGYRSYRDKSSARSAEAPASALGGMDLMEKDSRMDMEEKKEVAGTGMGERESHPTIQVAFDYNRGMYSLSDAVVIYYDFAKVTRPNPFPDYGFSPEMP